MSLNLLQSYSSAEDEEEEYEEEELSSDDEADDAVPRTSRSYKPLLDPNPPSSSSLPSAFDAFSEVSGPPQFLNNSVHEEAVKDDGQQRWRHGRKRNRKDNKGMPSDLGSSFPVTQIFLDNLLEARQTRVQLYDVNKEITADTLIGVGLHIALHSTLRPTYPSLDELNMTGAQSTPPRARDTSSRAPGTTEEPLTVMSLRQIASTVNVDDCRAAALAKTKAAADRKRAAASVASEAAPPQKKQAVAKPAPPPGQKQMTKTAPAPQKQTTKSVPPSASQSKGKEKEKAREKEPAPIRSGMSGMGACLLGWDPQRIKQVEDMARLGFLPSFLAEYVGSRSPTSLNSSGIPIFLQAAMESPVRAWTEEMQKCSTELSLNDKILASAVHLARSLGLLMSANAETSTRDFINPALRTAMLNVQERDKKLAELTLASNELKKKLAREQLEKETARAQLEAAQKRENEVRALNRVREEKAKELEGELKELEKKFKADKAEWGAEKTRLAGEWAVEKAELAVAATIAQAAAIEEALKAYKAGEGKIASNDGYVFAFIDIVQKVKEELKVDASPLRGVLLNFLADCDTSPFVVAEVNWDDLGGPLTEEERRRHPAVPEEEEGNEAPTPVEID